MDNFDKLIQFDDIYRNKKVLITGHTGFKGTWLALWLKKLGAKVYGISLPITEYNAHYSALNLGIASFEADILDYKTTSDIIKNVTPDIIFHLAAQALVRDSYLNPRLTYNTNVLGTLNVFESVRLLNSKVVIINVTSDKVYKNKEWNWPYRENDELGGYDPYSSSKAMSEILTDSYRNSFFNVNTYSNNHNVLLASVRAGNVIGGGDWAKDRIVPDVFRSTYQNKAVDIRNPKAIRPWQHVLEPLSGYLLLGSMLINENVNCSTAWNFGPDSHANITVLELVKKIASYWSVITYNELEYIGPHEAGILKLDSSLARAKLNWKPVLTIDDTINFTTDWYREKFENNNVISEKQLQRYLTKDLEKSSVWIKKKQ